MGKRGKTTTRHKEDNTFRFERFEDKLKKISTDVRLDIRDGRNTQLEEGETYLFQAIEKWTDLNRTESFGELIGDIGEDIQTLPQILNKKDAILNALLNHISEPTNKASFEPAFGLIIATARDLEAEFYPYFPAFFTRIINISTSSTKEETHLIENGFKCYAYLIKYLRIQIKRDLKGHLKLFAPLLDPKNKKYVVDFACEAFSVVGGSLGKVNPESFLNSIFEGLLKNHPEKSVGVGILLFSIFKSVNNGIADHTQWPNLSKCVAFIETLAEEDDKNLWLSSLKVLMEKILDHVKPDKTQIHWEVVEEHMCNKSINRDTLFQLYAHMISYYGERMTLIPLKPRVATLEKVFSSVEISLFIHTVFSLYECAFVKKSDLVNQLHPLILNVIEKIEDFPLIRDIDTVLKKCDIKKYFGIYLQPLISAYERTQHVNEISKLFSSKMRYYIHTVSETILVKSGFYNSDNNLFSGYCQPFYFLNKKEIVSTIDVSRIQQGVSKCCNSIGHIKFKPATSGEADIEELLKFFLVASRDRNKLCDKCDIKCKQMADNLLSHLNSSKTYSNEVLVPTMLLYYITEYLVVHSSLHLLNLDLTFTWIFSNLRFNKLDCVSLWKLKHLDLILHCIKKANHIYAMDLIKTRSNDFKNLCDFLSSGFLMIRSMTLSILLTAETIVHDKDPDEKLQAMYKCFLELDCMTECSADFSPMLKKTLTECQVVVNSEEVSDRCKEIVFKYTLGQMYRNYTQAWPLCVKVINTAGQKLKAGSFWDLFGKVFLQYYQEDSVVQNHFSFEEISDEPLSDFDKVRFTKSLHMANFFKLSKNGETETFVEKLDVEEYKCNLWKCLKGVNLQKEATTAVLAIVNDILGCKEFNTQLKLRNLKPHMKLLGPIFEFLEKCSRVGGDSLIWEIGVNMLTVVPKQIRMSVWKFILTKRTKDLKNYTEFIEELIEKDSLDVLLSMRSDALDTTLDQRFANESTTRRALVMKIVLRLLIGKERELNPKQRKVILRFVAGCTESEAESYIDLCDFSTADSSSPKVAEMKINKIKNILSVWEYTFPHLLFKLVNQMCALVRSTELNAKISMNETSAVMESSDAEKEEDGETEGNVLEVPQEVMEEWKRRALKAARSCLVLFFEKFTKLNLTRSVVNNIFELFIWPVTSELSTYSNSGISWALVLFNIWSSHEKYHPLLAKSCKNDIRTSPMESLYDLLASPSAKDDVKEYVMNILLNLGKTDDVDVDSKAVIFEHMDTDEEPQDTDITDLFDTNTSSLRIGWKILLYRMQDILNLLKETKFLKKLLNGPSGESWLQLISQLVEHVDDERSKESLCSIMMDTLILSKTREDNLCHALVACKTLMTNLKNHKTLLLKLGYCFTWMKDRRPRTALCSILESYEDTLLYDSMRNVNSWIENQASDVPNYSERHQGYSALTKRVRQNFEIVSYTMASYQCFHDILHDSDLGIRTSAVNLLVAIAESVSLFSTKGNNTKKAEIRKFLDSVIIPRLKGGIKHQDDSKFADFIKTLLSFVMNVNTVHGTFKELHTIFKLGKEDPEILTRLTDIKVNMKTRALNSLCKRVEEDGANVSAATLLSFVTPLANHYLLVQKSDSKSQFNELVDASIGVKRAVLNVLPHDQYFKNLRELVVSPEKTKLMAKRYERVLIATLDAFHFDLSLGVITNTHPAATPVATTIVEPEEMELVEETENDVVNEVEEFVKVPRAAARKYLQHLKQKIIPKLRKYLKFEEKATHKLSRSDNSLNDEVRLKIPCTLALVKLLKKLPISVCNDGIGSIIPSLCAKMGDKDVRVRNEMRQTIVSVVKELGTNQLGRVISYLRASLQRGYKKHVLNYTVKHLLVGLDKELRENPGHVPVKSIIPICEDELFGIMEEEKDVQKIIQKTAEASRSNAYLLIKTCAKFLQTKEYYSLIEPAIRQSEQKKKEKIVKICRRWLSSVSEGLSENADIDPASFLTWLHQLKLKHTESTKTTEATADTKAKKFLTEVKDHKLITVVKRQGQGTIAGEKKITGSFLMEFIFTCLYNVLKKAPHNKDTPTVADCLELLDRFVEHLAKEIRSPSKDVSIMAFRCCSLLFQFELNSFLSQKYQDMFWTGGILGIDTHHEMFNVTFKFLHAFLVRFPSYNISKQDLTLIFSSIQGQLHNDTCSASALTMLKEILQIKLNHSSIKGLMKDVFDNSITSPYLHINEGCRLVYLTYFSNYLDATKEQQITEEVAMIGRQLSYRIEQGRLSAVAAMTSVISLLPEGIFNTLKEFIFMEMLLALGNEDSSTVKEKLYEGIQLLFKREKNKSLMSLLIALFSDKEQMPNYDTFFLVAGSVMNDVSLCDQSQFIELLSIVHDTLSEDTEKEWPEIPDMTQQARDSTIFQCLSSLRKCILRKLDKLPLWSRKGKCADIIENILKRLREVFMYYEHEWIPLAVVRIFDVILDTLDSSSLNSIAQFGTLVSQTDELFELNKSLWNLHCHTKNEELDKEAINVMFKLIRLTVSLKTSDVLEKLVMHFYRSVQVEVVKHAKEFHVRRIAFECFYEMIAHCPEDAVEPVSARMIRICVRDLTDDNVPSEVKALAEKLTNLLRERLGNDRFNCMYAELSDKLHAKRHENRAKKKEQVVQNPGKQRKRPKKPVNFANGFAKKRKVSNNK